MNKKLTIQYEFDVQCTYVIYRSHDRIDHTHLLTFLAIAGSDLLRCPRSLFLNREGLGRELAATGCRRCMEVVRGLREELAMERIGERVGGECIVEGAVRCCPNLKLWGSVLFSSSLSDCIEKCVLACYLINRGGRDSNIEKHYTNCCYPITRKEGDGGDSNIENTAFEVRDVYRKSAVLLRNEKFNRIWNFN